MVTTGSGMACSDSHMTLLLWSMNVHIIVCALYRGTPAVLSARAHLLDVIFGDYCYKHFFPEADSLQTLSTHQNSNGQSLVTPNECDPIVYSYI